MHFWRKLKCWILQIKNIKQVKTNFLDDNVGLGFNGFKNWSTIRTPTMNITTLEEFVSLYALITFSGEV